MSDKRIISVALRKSILQRDNYTCKICKYHPPVHDLSEETNCHQTFDQIKERILFNKYTIIVVTSPRFTPIKDATLKWFYDEKLEIDHITSISDEGDANPDNLQTLCHTCHSKKSARERFEAKKMREQYREQYLSSKFVGTDV
jgi:5-methylcytosine-specific restriction endonuclease McrA